MNMINNTVDIYFPRDVSETHTSFHSTELKLILRSDFNYIFFVASKL